MPCPVIPCVGAVIRDDSGRLLLIKRGHEPGAGLWSLPGGRIEPGETDAAALIRELREETGLTVRTGELLGSVQRPAGDGGVFDIRDYAATIVSGSLAAGDDAAAARWVSPAELDRLPLTEGLVEALTTWGVLPLPTQALPTQALPTQALATQALPAQAAAPALTPRVKTGAAVSCGLADCPYCSTP